MANLMDYLAWRGEFRLEAAPFNPVDALLLSMLSYLDFRDTRGDQGRTLAEAFRMELLEETGNPEYFPERKAMFLAMADSNRFRDCRMHHAVTVTDDKLEMQFSALCLNLPDNTLAVVFRGTDNTFTGWKENFNMAYQSPVPGQEAAMYYLELASQLDNRPLRIMGHSKGGNLAAYAAAVSPEEIRNRIESVWSFDGPGMSEEVFASEGYRKILPVLHHYVPRTGIIGMLMAYHREYTVVQANASGIQQHDPFTWQILGSGFETLPEIDTTAQVTRETLQEWLAACPKEKRAAFVDTLFRLVDNTKATTMSELFGEKMRNMMSMVGGSRDVDPETRRVFTRLMAQFVTLGVGNVLERRKGRKESDAGPTDDGDGEKEGN